jgi:hypothetical protein
MYVVSQWLYNLHDRTCLQSCGFPPKLFIVMSLNRSNQLYDIDNKLTADC